MPGYESNNLLAASPAQWNMTSAYQTAIELTAQTAFLRRIFVFEIGFSCDGTPANNSITCDVSRITASGTGVASTPDPLDPADGVAASLTKINDTIEPTVTAQKSLWTRAINQQLSFLWGAMGAKSLLVGPATNANGLCLRAKSAAYTSTCIASVKFED